MQLYYKARENGCAVRVYVPTTVYENLAARVVITTRSRRSAEYCIRLQNLPHWDIPRQALLLKQKDENRLESRVNRLLKAV